MTTSNGRTSPSFVIAIALVVLVIGGYAVWQFRTPRAHGRSEEIVREFVSAAGRELADFRRNLNAMAELERPDGAGAEAALAKVDAAVAEVLARIDEAEGKARARLEEIEDLPLRTLRNRLARIDRRLEETKQVVTEFAEATKQKLARRFTPAEGAPS